MSDERITLKPGRARNGAFVSTQTAKDRFWAHVPQRKRFLCWLWRGVILNTGYGQFKDCGVRYGAHQFSYLLAHGNLPRGMMVCHKCDEPTCVNPAHLFLGTNQDNLRDASKKGRTCRGERHHWSKLTAASVLQIRALYVPRLYPQRRLAREFNTSQTHIKDILKRRVWNHV